MTNEENDKKSEFTTKDEIDRFMTTYEMKYNQINDTIKWLVYEMDKNFELIRQRLERHLRQVNSSLLKPRKKPAKKKRKAAPKK